MRNKQIVVAAAAVLVCMIDKEEKMKTQIEKKRNNRTVKSFLSKRPAFDIEAKMISDLLYDGDVSFKNFTRLTHETFEILHGLIENEIKKEEITMRETISTRARLGVTLRYLASGNSYMSLEYLTRISKSTISLFVPEVTAAIYGKLKDPYLKIPNSQTSWKKVSKEFAEILSFPNVIGAIDGKHIDIQNPSNSGSYFFNYKGRFSVVLLAMVDAKGNFLYVDVGCNGRISDGGVFRNSSLNESLQNETLNLPDDQPLPRRQKNVPYVIVGDDAFALSKNILKYYSRGHHLSAKEQIFNYRISLCRNIVERAFGRLVSRFRIFKRPLDLKLENIDKIVLACCALHNFLNKNDQSYIDHSITDIPFLNITHERSNHSSQEALAIRNEFADYFMNEGVLDFQWNILM